MSEHWKSLLLQIRRPIFENNQIENTVFLNASGRSGSTWLGEVINHRNDYRLIFEPFHPYRSIALFEGLTQREYLVKRGDNPRLEEGIELVLSGRIRHPWVDHLNRRIRIGKRLVKAIRANLMLPYIQEHYPQVKIVFLIRHPLPTVMSRIRMGWNHLLDDFTKQKHFCMDYGNLLRNLDILGDTVVCKHLHSWCLEHYVPLKRLQPDNVHVVFYESLMSDPQATCAPLFEFLDLEMDETLESRLNTPSAMSAEKRADAPGREFSIEQEQVEKILRLYDLDFLYDSFGQPKTRSEDVLSVLKA